MGLVARIKKRTEVTSSAQRRDGRPYLLTNVRRNVGENAGERIDP